jgi:hypothetical protein
VSTAGKWTFPMVFAQDTSPYSQDIPKTTVPEWIACLLPHLLGKVLPWKASRISKWTRSQTSESIFVPESRSNQENDPTTRHPHPGLTWDPSRTKRTIRLHPTVTIFGPPDRKAETWWQHCFPHSHCAVSTPPLRFRPHPLVLRLSAVTPPPSLPFTRLPLRRSPCLPLYRHRASLSALLATSLSAVSPPRSPPRRLGVGRMTTKSLRWPSAVIGCGNGGRMRTHFHSLQWRVASDTEYGVR